MQPMTKKIYFQPRFANCHTVPNQIVPDVSYHIDLVPVHSIGAYRYSDMPNQPRTNTVTSWHGMGPRTKVADLASCKIKETLLTSVVEDFV